MRRAVHRVLALRLSRRTDTPLERLLLMATAHHRNLRSQAELAAHFLIEPSAVSRMVDRLETDGYAVRVPGEDRRRIHLELTEAGLGQLTLFEETLETLTRDLEGELSASEQEVMGALLEKTERALEAALSRELSGT